MIERQEEKWAMMTFDERERLNAAARERALKEIMSPELTWLFTDDPNAHIPIVSEMTKKFREFPREKHLGVFFEPQLGYTKALKVLLTVPTTYTWIEYTEENAIDPISGNQKPKTRQASALVDGSDKIAEARREFMGYLCRQTAAARTMSSPTAADYRALYIELRHVFADGCYLTPLEESCADEVVAKLTRLEFEILIDSEISNAEREVGHARARS